MLKHSHIIQLVTALTPGFSDDGVCNGYSSMWLQSHLLALETQNCVYSTQFYNRENHITKHYLKNGVLDTASLKKDIQWAKDYFATLKTNTPNSHLEKKALKLLDILAFAQGIYIHQSPQELTKLFNQALPQQPSSNVLYQCTRPTAAKFDFATDNIPPVAFPDKDALVNYLLEFEKILQLHKSKGNHGFLLSTDCHTIAVYYNQHSSKWCFMDINNKSRGINKVDYDSHQLANELYRVFGQKTNKPVLFSIYKVSTQQDPKLSQALKKLSIQNQQNKNAIELKDGNKVTLLYLASLISDLKTVKKLLETHNNPIKYLKQVTSKGATPLWIAVQNGHYDVVKLLLSKHNNPTEYLNQANSKGSTPLFIAAQNGHYDIAKLLLSEHDNPTEYLKQANSAGNTPLWIAAKNGHHDVAKLLLSEHNNITEYLNQAGIFKTSPLWIAARNGHYDVVKLLLFELDDPTEYLKQENSKGNTPLLMAAQNGYYDIVKLLLSEHDNPTEYLNQVGMLKTSPLWIAARNGHHDIVKLLLSEHDNPTEYLKQANSAGKPPLWEAVQNEHLKVVKVLLNCELQQNPKMSINQLKSNYPKHITQCKIFNTVLEQIKQKRLEQQANNFAPLLLNQFKATANTTPLANQTTPKAISSSVPKSRICQVQ